MEHNEIKEFLLEQGEKEENITEKLIEENRDYYFDYLYNDDYKYRRYNEDGTYETYRDEYEAEEDRIEEERKNTSWKITISN